MIAVVGGGISGLAAGHYLAAAGMEVTVLEATARAGGVIGTVHGHGRILDLGPQRARLTPPLSQLVESLHLSDQLVTAPDLPLFIYADGGLRRVPIDLATVLTTDLLAWPDRLRILLEPFTQGIRDHENAADFFTRKFGRRTYRRVIAPLFGGLYASDPAEMRARHALASVLTTLGVDGSLLRALVRGARSHPRFPACSFRDGMETLPRALARELGDRLWLESPVHEIQRDRGGFRLHLEHREVRADRVVLTCPSAAAARMLAALDPESAARLHALRVNSLATVHMESEAALGAMGYQVALDDKLATHGVTSQHDLFLRSGLYTAFLGGAGRERIAALPDVAVAGMATAEFEGVTGFAARALVVHRTEIPAWDTSWDALDALDLPDGIEICASWRDRPGITGRLLDARRVARRLCASMVPVRPPGPARSERRERAASVTGETVDA